jgi:hypothetical protein
MSVFGTAGNTRSLATPRAAVADERSAIHARARSSFASDLLVIAAHPLGPPLEAWRAHSTLRSLVPGRCPPLAALMALAGMSALPDPTRLSRMKPQALHDSINIFAVLVQGQADQIDLVGFRCRDSCALVYVIVGAEQASLSHSAPFSSLPSTCSLCGGGLLMRQTRVRRTTYARLRIRPWEPSIEVHRPPPLPPTSTNLHQQPPLLAGTQNHP